MFITTVWIIEDVNRTSYRLNVDSDYLKKVIILLSK